MFNGRAEGSMPDDFPGTADDMTSYPGGAKMINACWYLPKIQPEMLKLTKQTKGKLSSHDALIALTLREEAIRGIITLDGDYEIAWLERIG